MTRRRALLYIAILSILFLMLHRVALLLDLYWIFPWFDYVMHALGGGVVGFLSLALFAVGRAPNQKLYYLISFIGTLALALIWEIIEYKTGLTFTTVEYPLDTLSDIGASLLAALGVAHLAYPLTK